MMSNDCLIVGKFSRDSSDKIFSKEFLNQIILLGNLEKYFHKLGIAQINKVLKA